MHYLHFLAQPGRYHKVDVHTYNLPNQFLHYKSGERKRAGGKGAKAKQDKKSRESRDTAVGLAGDGLLLKLSGEQGEWRQEIMGLKVEPMSS